MMELHVFVWGIAQNVYSHSFVKLQLYLFNWTCFVPVYMHGKFKYYSVEIMRLILLAYF